MNLLSVGKVKIKPFSLKTQQVSPFVPSRTFVVCYITDIRTVLTLTIINMSQLGSLLYVQRASNGHYNSTVIPGSQTPEH